MRVIGITGGVGAGKSEVLRVLSDICRCRIVMTDRVAEELQQPGQICYKELTDLLGNGILKDRMMGNEIDRPSMAAVIFKDDNLLKRVNEIVHPRVWDAVKGIIDDENTKGVLNFVFVESALFDGSESESILDELWYVYADPEVRIDRLMKSRGYSRKKAVSIMDNQTSDEDFRKISHRVIDNSRDIKSLESILEEMVTI